MTKQEFLDGLRRSLSAGLESGQINEHVRYYSDYIDSKVRMGTPEEEVMASLGEPRWIAKTILGMEEVDAVTEEYVEDDNIENNKYRYFDIKGKTLRLPTWLFTILICVVCFFVLTLVFSLMAQLLPFLFLAIFVTTIIRFLKNLFR